MLTAASKVSYLVRQDLFNNVTDLSCLTSVKKTLFGNKRHIKDTSAHVRKSASEAPQNDKRHKRYIRHWGTSIYTRVRTHKGILLSFMSFMSFIRSKIYKRDIFFHIYNMLQRN